MWEPEYCQFNKQYRRRNHIDYIGPTGDYGPHQFAETSRYKDTIRAICMFCLKIFIAPYIEVDCAKEKETP